MMKYILGTVLLVFCAATIAFVYTNNKKIVYIDNYRIYQEFNKKKVYEKEFDGVKQNQKATLDSLGIEVEMLKRKLEAADKQTGKTIMQEIEANTLKYQKLYSGFENANSAKAKQYNEQIWNELNISLKDFSKESGYDIVLGGNGSGSVMYANEKMDVTDAAIKYVNKKYEGK